MQKSKLIDKLRLVERDEMRDLGKFVESPFFNKDDKVVRLFDYLKKYHPVFEHKKLERDYIAKKLFPEWKDNAYKKLSHIMSRLANLVDDYFVWKETEYDASERYHALLKAYKRRKGDWFFDSAVGDFRKHLEKQPERGTDYYFHQYRMNEEIYTHTATERVQTDINSLDNAINNLDLFYFGKKFMYCSEVRFRELYLAEKSELVLLDEMLKAVEHPFFKENHFIQIFSTIVQLYQTREKTVYEKLKNLIREGDAKVSTEERSDMILMANNFCVLECNRGETSYLEEIFGWYEFGLQEGILIAEYMTHTTYLNIVNVACTLQKFDWTDNFIKEYVKYLRNEVQESTRIIAKSQLEFAMGNFEETLELLRDTDFVDVQHSVRAKAYQLKCYYELKGYEMLFYDACNAFAQYCRRNKVIGEQSRIIALNFISFIKKLYQAKYQKTEGQQILLTKLEQTPVMFSRWFKTKIEQDIKGK